MRFIFFAFIIWFGQAIASAQQCSYRTDEPLEVPRGHMLITIKGPPVSLVKGDVSDQAGSSMKGVAVVLTRLKGKKGQYIGGTWTDEKGRFCFGTLSEGQYRLEFGKRDFNSVRIEFRVVAEPKSSLIQVDLPAGT
jgi:5-hydroxyisourate hydrolase-like protein (transthyretin family)